MWNISILPTYLHKDAHKYLSHTYKHRTYTLKFLLLTSNSYSMCINQTGSAKGTPQSFFLNTKWIYSFIPSVKLPVCISESSYNKESMTAQHNHLSCVSFMKHQSYLHIKCLSLMHNPVNIMQTKRTNEHNFFRIVFFFFPLWNGWKRYQNPRSTSVPVNSKVKRFLPPLEYSENRSTCYSSTIYNKFLLCSASRWMSFCMKTNQNRKAP